ncbi:DCN1-like protein 2 [Trypanosoma grayi]|uniref:DCN1-like protein 2 n=1 Tax=Trypanosoma grayi TaxID=71804 RepID=UPI0004F4B78A|nr:DCN1-like protein 2 [Trypanosoma grayi]KEG15461.1 DCN1-like protein 2 [Trypanosoma grayi]
MPPKAPLTISVPLNSAPQRTAPVADAQRPLGSATTVRPNARPIGMGRHAAGVPSGRNEMESYFERLLALGRVNGLDAMGAKGIEQLCGDLSITLNSFEMYTLIWKMGITRGGCIPRADWLTTMYAYKIKHPIDLKLNLTEWVKEAREEAFIEFYNELYDYIRGEEARLMPADNAIKAWAVLFAHEPRIRSWIEWYTVVHKRDVTRDVWRQLAVFFSTVPKIEVYSVEDKWPSAIDSYVEWCVSSH